MVKRSLFVIFAGVLAVWIHVASAVQRDLPVSFSNITAQAGITFKHENGASREKYMPETMGSGVVVLDYNNDGWPDILFVNGGSFADEQAAARARHTLYRNNRDGTFTDVSAVSGIGISGFGMGACSADYDNDGFPDLYVTSVGSNRLYRTPVPVASSMLPIRPASPPGSGAPVARSRMSTTMAISISSLRGT